jgi:hypothetical protein
MPVLLAFTALANLAASIATIGVFFLAESAHGFTTAENYQLGLLLGVTYALAAWKAGPILALFARDGARISGRGALITMTLVLAAVCLLPYLVQAKWSIYLFVGIYAPITGVFWSLVESFLSGGRSGASLRRALGSFNVTWSGFMALSMWLIAPLVKDHPLEILVGVALAHLASLVFLVRFDRDPARHVEEAHHAPPHYRVLLAGHQVLLVACYLVMFALSPYLPELMDELAVPAAWRTPLGSVWMPVRVVVFYWLGSWQGWHGRRGLGAWGALFLVVGFALTVAAPHFGAHTSGIVALVVGQSAFGIALAGLYTANLYYSMAVGQSSVEASGSHEGLIGLGYTIGPLCGWAAGALSHTGCLAPDHVDDAILFSIEALAIGAALWAWRVTQPRA